MPEIILLPSFKKRLILLGLIIVFGALVTALVRFPSPAFILYFGLCIAAFVYMVLRLFNRKSVLTLSEKGVFSRMTINGARMGLISWRDITEIRDAPALWFIKGIELHANEAVAEKYQARLDKKDRMAKRKTFLLHLSSEEVDMKHEDLLLLLNESWNKYRNDLNLNEPD